MSNIIHAILESRIFEIISRIVVTFVFWSAGLAGALGFSERVAEMSHFGLEPAPVYAVVTTIWLLVGSALVIVNRAAWAGAGSLAVFTLLTIPIAHAFWTMEEPQRTAHFHVVVEHVSLIGAMMVVAILCHRSRRTAA